MAGLGRDIRTEGGVNGETLEREEQEHLKRLLMWCLSQQNLVGDMFIHSTRGPSLDPHEKWGSMWN